MTSAPRPVGQVTAPAAVEAVVLDLDGTCLDARDQSLHPRIRAAVRAAAERLPVIVATGRMYRSALPWCRELGIRAPAVCYQGAMVREMPPPAGSSAVLLEEAVAPAAALTALRVAREHGWHRQAYQDDTLLCEEERPETDVYARIAAVPVTLVDDLEPLLRHGSTKMVCVVLEEDAVQRCIATMKEALPSDTRVTRSLPQFVEIVNASVSKAAACELVCERLGVSLSRAAAIGDAPNDLEVLDAAGFAVAVSTAPPEVLARADATCAPPRQGGVADVLEKLGLC